jgi:LytS/YehU family sensor histidine kinase
MLKDELEVLQAYTFLLKTRFGENLLVDIEIPKGENAEKDCTPFFAVTDGECHQAQYSFCR